MERVSSQLTIFIRIALPTIWLTTLISLTILLIVAVQGRAQVFANPIVWIVFLLILGSGLLFIKFVLWRIYRVDMDNQYLYISNYLRTFKYPFSDVQAIEPSKILPERVYRIILKSKGTFGKEIYFLASQKLWKDFVTEHPSLFKDIFQPAYTASQNGSPR